MFKIRSKMFCDNQKLIDDDEKECSICLESLKLKNPEKKIISINSCNHQFHYSCLITWLQIKPICPYCREPINGYFNTHIFKGSKLFPTKINLLLKVDENYIYLYERNKEKTIYKTIPYSKLKKITVIKKKLILYKYPNEQVFLNTKDIKYSRIIYNVISEKFLQFKHIL